MREVKPDNATVQTDATRAGEAGAALASAPASAPLANTYRVFGVKRLWSFVAALGLLIAAALGWRGHYDATFVVATLGVVAWFLDQRNLLRARRIEADTTEDEGTEFEDEQSADEQ